MRAIIQVGSQLMLVDKDQSVDSLMNLVEKAIGIKGTYYGSKYDYQKYEDTKLGILLVPDNAIAPEEEDGDQ